VNQHCADITTVGCCAMCISTVLWFWSLL